MTIQNSYDYQRARKNRMPRLILVSKKEKEKEKELQFIDKISDYEDANWRNYYGDEPEMHGLITWDIHKLIKLIALLTKQKIKKIIYHQYL